MLFSVDIPPKMRRKIVTNLTFSDAFFVKIHFVTIAGETNSLRVYLNDYAKRI